MTRPSHDRILAAAERVFAERGYGDTSLRELIAAAECSTTAFYARFASKEVVLETLIRELLDDLRDAAIEALPRAKNVSQGWDEGVEVLVRTLQGRKGLVRVALTEAARVGAPRQALQRAYGTLVALLAEQLRRADRKRAGDSAEPEARAWALVGTLTMQVSRWAVFEELDDASLADALRSTARTLLPRPRRKTSA